MPVLSELRRRGRVTEMATATDLEAAIYPTLHCGVEVSNHGLYTRWSGAPRNSGFATWIASQPPTVWERIAAVGGSSLVVDPYQLWRSSAGSEGVSLSGWQFRHKVIPSGVAPRRAWKGQAPIWRSASPHGRRRPTYDRDHAHDASRAGRRPQPRR